MVSVDDKLKRDTEALLFSSGRAMSEDSLCSILDADPKEIKRVLKELHQEYRDRETALMIFEDEGSWRMLVHDVHIPVVQRVVADTELSRQTIATLAIVAYHYPKILQADVIKTRGTSAYDHIKELEVAGFISRTPEGRSFAIKLTEKFFEYFDVDGAENIRDVFKDVDVPEVPVAKVGDLDVVDVPPGHPHDPESEKLGLEVIDVDENPFMKRELGTKPQLTPEERVEQNEFLAKMEEKIGSVSGRNDVNDEDDTFKPMTFGDEEGASNDEGEASTGDTSDDKSEDEETADDVIAEVRRMHPGGEGEGVRDDYVENAHNNSDDEDTDEGEEKKSALDEPLDLDEI